MIRHPKIARDTAVKSWSQAMVTLKTLIINAPANLRAAIEQIRGKVALIRHMPPSGQATSTPRWLVQKRLCEHWRVVGQGCMTRSEHPTKNWNVLSPSVLLTC